MKCSTDKTKTAEQGAQTPKGSACNTSTGCGTKNTDKDKEKSGTGCK
ncbi:MAG: hypothetical protein IJ979_03110 [Tidjanibacter sp.]|nr:hypothetical protein [Tidjanibacter sp.]MBR4037944.1 hypothetical protein [Tidjanibacter sp.]MBR4064392.1 hypothetical protein [Tidjanibacter sp.]MBR6813505.1 hypothetical protein [Tidjanibacter sp.]